MALKPCRECTREISSSALSCPMCRAPQYPKRMRAILLILLVPFVPVLLLIGMFFGEFLRN